MSYNRFRISRQQKQVLDYLQSHEGMTVIDAEKLGIKRLASRIGELRKSYKIESEMIMVTDRFGYKVKVANYQLIKERIQQVKLFNQIDPDERIQG